MCAGKELKVHPICVNEVKSYLKQMTNLEDCAPKYPLLELRYEPHVNVFQMTMRLIYVHHIYEKPIPEIEN